MGRLALEGHTPGYVVARKSLWCRAMCPRPDARAGRSVRVGLRSSYMKTQMPRMRRMRRIVPTRENPTHQSHAREGFHLFGAIRGIGGIRGIRDSMNGEARPSGRSPNVGRQP